jgi:hypothetical protein
MAIEFGTRQNHLARSSALLDLGRSACPAPIQLRTAATKSRLPGAPRLNP